jgi:hypothetical protein
MSVSGTRARLGVAAGRLVVMESAAGRLVRPPRRGGRRPLQINVPATSLNVSSSRFSISFSSSIGIPSGGSIRMTCALL